jgi:ribosomal protein S24E
MTVSDLLEQPCNKSDNAIKLVPSCKQLVPNLLQQLGTSSANTTCRQLVNRFGTTCAFLRVYMYKKRRNLKKTYPTWRVRLIPRNWQRRQRRCVELKNKIYFMLLNERMLKITECTVAFIFVGFTKALGNLGNIVAETLFPANVSPCFPEWANTRKH